MDASQSEDNMIEPLAELMNLYQRLEVESMDETMYKDVFMTHKQYDRLHKPDVSTDSPAMLPSDAFDNVAPDVPVPANASRKRSAREPKKKKRKIAPEAQQHHHHDEHLQLHEDELQLDMFEAASALDVMPSDLSEQLRNKDEEVARKKKAAAATTTAAASNNANTSTTSTVVPPATQKKTKKEPPAPIVAPPTKDKKKKKRDDSRKRPTKIQIPEIREYPWMPVEDEALLALIRIHGTDNFDFISSELDSMFGPSPVPRNYLSCQTRYQRLLARKEMIQAAEAAEAAKKDVEPIREEITTTTTTSAPEQSKEMNVGIYLDISKQNITRMINIWFPKKDGQGRGRKKGPIEKKITKKATKKPIRPKLAENGEYKAPLELAAMLQKAVPPSVLPDHTRQVNLAKVLPAQQSTSNATTTVLKGSATTTTAAPSNNNTANTNTSSNNANTTNASTNAPAPATTNATNTAPASTTNTAPAPAPAAPVTNITAPAPTTSGPSPLPPAVPAPANPPKRAAARKKKAKSPVVNASNVASPSTASMPLQSAIPASMVMTMPTPMPSSSTLPPKPPAVLVNAPIPSAFPTPNASLTPTHLVPSVTGTFTASFAPRVPVANPMATMANPMFARAAFPMVPTTTTAPNMVVPTVMPFHLAPHQTMLMPNAAPTPIMDNIAIIAQQLRTALAHTPDKDERLKIAQNYVAKYPQLSAYIQRAQPKKPPPADKK